MSSYVFGTAGHIDHGKTALVQALTGIDTDRLKEEQARGITIELGFAEIDLGDGLHGGFVDVPGHEAFVRAMVAGASGMDAALIVIAADEGPMPQTYEHLTVLEFMGVRKGVVALTKSDLVDPDWMELVQDEVRELLESRSIEGIRIIPTSVKTGQGLEELRSALADLARLGSDREVDDVLRLPIDRAFTVRGTGTVVTGTIWSGSVREGQRVFFLPAGRDARVRRIHVHGREMKEANAGSRAALALAGVPTDDVPRGSDVVDVEAWGATERITACVRLTDPAAFLDRGRRVRVHLGTAEVMARAFPLGELPDGSWIEFRLEQPLLSRAGDRMVLRSYSPVTTIGGGTVLEPDPPRRKSSRARAADVAGLLSDGPAERVLAAVSLTADAGLMKAMIPIVAGITSARTDLVDLDDRFIVLEDRVYAASVADRLEGGIIEAVKGYHARHPLEPGIPVERLRPEGRERLRLLEDVLRRLVSGGTLDREGGRIRISGFLPALTTVQEARASSLAARLQEAGLDAPGVPDLVEEGGDLDETQALLEYLVRTGVVVRLSASIVLDSLAVGGFVERVRTELGGRRGLGPADFRPIADVSRRILVPLLQHLDVHGVTVRVGDLRDVVG